MKKYTLRTLALVLMLTLLMSTAGSALTLRYPQRSSHVTTLQTALSLLGYYNSTVDGVYGKGTREAVRSFQKAYGLSADGVAGPATLGKIEDLTGIQVGGSTSTTPDAELPSGAGLFGGVYTTLQFGAKGDRVRILQRALTALGFTITVDGDFGSATYLAVKDFQKATGLSVDGKAGKNTLKKLETYFDKNGNCISGPLVTQPPADDAEDPDYDVPTRTLRYGMSGADVKYTQQRLYTLGYYTGERDGQFGSGMLSAVKAFQRKNNLTADGVIGANTRKVLFSTGAIAADGAGSDATPTPTPVQTLQRGDEGEAVKKLQTRLKELGYYTNTLDGEFGSGTYTAVCNFQSRNGLTVTGKADANTQAKLYSDDAIGAKDDLPTDEETSAPTPTPTPGVTPSRTLRLGATGEDVKLVQNRLIALGYLTTAANGEYDSNTQAAVKAFQKRNSLSVDGVAGPKTYQKLFSDNPVAAPTPTPTPETLVIPDRALTRGDTGEDVKSVQKRLKELEYLTSAADGEYGSGTEAAMRAFQQMNNLSVTGNGSQATYAKLYSDDAINAKGVKLGQSVPSYTNLKSGATGTAVIRLQQALAALDYDVNVTGIYDTATSQAVRSFQALNSLSVDGVAGKNTQTKLYSGSAKKFPTGPDGAIYGSMGYVSAPAKSQIQLLHWKDELKDTLSYGDALLCYDPATGISWSLTIIARGRHCDVEPTTAMDTAAMHAAFGGVEDWTPKPVYVRLPDGRWTVATTHNVAHGVNPIPDNDFEGQNCVHFLRDMSEAELNDPDYGVTNQKALRAFWKELTGQEIAYK